MVCPLWNFACGGQRGFITCVSLKSAMKGPNMLARAEKDMRARPSILVLDRTLAFVICVLEIELGNRE